MSNQTLEELRIEQVLYLCETQHERPEITLQGICKALYRIAVALENRNLHDGIES